MLSLLIAVLPSALKIACLRMRGATIGKDCHIGFSIIDAKSITIGDNVRIASFNLMHRIDSLVLKSGSRLNGFNWITGAGTGSFHLGRNSAITRFHFFEASASILIDDNTIVAGRGSHFFTHGISSTNLDDMRPIRIGPWCYVGTSCRFVPGAEIAEGTFVGMGSVVTKRLTEPYTLVAGAPAVVKKRLSPRDVYFDRPFLPHDHHGPNYGGGLE